LIFERKEINTNQFNYRWRWR